MLGKYQSYLVDLDLFTPNEIACLVCDLDPISFNISNREYEQTIKMIETSIKAGRLKVFNDEGLILVDEVKRYLADKGYTLERFNDSLDEAVLIDCNNNKPAPSQENATSQLNDHTEKSYQTTIGLLLELMTTPKGIDDKAPFQSQATIIGDILDKDIQGQRKTTLENRFRDANLMLADAKKKRPKPK